MRDQLKFWTSYALVYLPRPLPVGLTAFDAWAKRVIGLAGPYADEDSMRFALASNILHLGSQQAYVPDIYFLRVLRKAAANQVSSQVFQDIKLKQQLAAQAQAEVTASDKAASDVQTPA